MADDSSRTEKATPRRLEKARKEGNFVTSREFPGSLQFFVFFLLLSQFATPMLIGSREALRELLQAAISQPSVSLEMLVELFRHKLLPLVFPLLLAGAGLTATMIAAQLAVSRFGFSAKKLSPSIDKLNPLSKLKDMPRQNFSSFVQALVLLPLMLGAVYLVASDHAAQFLHLPLVPLQPGSMLVGIALKDLLWKGALAFLLLGSVDWYRQHSRYNKQMRMSKQEIRDEAKESDGNPQVKQRLRKIQRDLSRKRMMHSVPKAAAIIVNPTHYAVAIQYDLGSMAAPKVVAKGKNYLARRIREIATAHEIPIVENPPLARAIYAAVEVGQEIPPHLYRAIAEILAYLYRLLGGRLPGNSIA